MRLVTGPNLREVVGDAIARNSDGCGVVRGHETFDPNPPQRMVVRRRGVHPANRTAPVRRPQQDSGETGTVKGANDIPDVEVRDAQADDEAEIRRCVQAAYSPYVERIGKPPAPMLDDYARLIDRGVVRVATQRGEIAGLIVMWPEEDHLYVDNIAVDPGAQGIGVGAALLADADDRARQTGRDEVRLYTNTAMVENIDYYPRRGYSETHRATDAGYNRVYFSRELRDT